MKTLDLISLHASKQFQNIYKQLSQSHFVDKIILCNRCEIALNWMFKLLCDDIVLLP